MITYNYLPFDIQLFHNKFQYNRDRVKRHPKSGENNHNSRLSEKKVRQIRLSYRHDTCTQEALARRYHVGRSTINDVIHYRTWKHVAPYLEQDEIITATKFHSTQADSQEAKCIFVVQAIMADNEAKLIDIIPEDSEASRKLAQNYPNMILLGEYQITPNEFDSILMGGEKNEINKIKFLHNK